MVVLPTKSPQHCNVKGFRKRNLPDLLVRLNQPYRDGLAVDTILLYLH